MTPLRPLGSALFAAALLLALGGCGDPDVSWKLDPNDDNKDTLCAPTGRIFIDTGVHLGPKACDEVTLYRPKNASSDCWLMSVSWPMFGEYWVLELKNRRTGDSHKELLYLGDPEFMLYAGTYNLGGFEVAEGENPIDYKIYKTVEHPDGSYSQTVKDQGLYTLEVILKDQP